MTPLTRYWTTELTEGDKTSVHKSYKCVYLAADVEAALDEIAEVTGIAGVDEPMDVLECVRALRQIKDDSATENAALRAEVERLKSVIAGLVNDLDGARQVMDANNIPPQARSEG